MDKTNKIKPKYKLTLNDVNNLQDLMQELYDESTKNINEIQNEINKLSQSTQLNDEMMDAKTKYAKAMNDFSSNKNKALTLKLDIAKLMAEIIKFNGNVKKATEQMEEVPEDWGEFMGTLNEKAIEKESGKKREIYKVR
jgi:uncharacterized protein Yka (UPF0111/DUF47 family)